MTAPDMQFGEVEQVGVQTARRPDRNRHFAVAACGRPGDDDLPIFVDLDAMLEMEAHALSDTRVELGGVLLGGQHEDERGKPFVLVTDCLAARHYQSTKGSFKFTHDTWQEITRERDEFPAEIQMVGWYHTHPGWGVFLSGLDNFICDNFFNRPLDLALVIDPCQQDRGFFQWSGGPPARTERTGGFYLVASRFRHEELAMHAHYLGGKAAMRGDADQAYTPYRTPAPVVHISEGRSGWLGAAVVGTLIVQVLLIMLVAWRLAMPPGQAPESGPAAMQLAAIEERLDALQQGQAEGRLAAERAVLDRVLGEIEVAPGGLVSSLTEEQAENTRLRTGFDALQSEHQRLQTDLKRMRDERDSIDQALTRLKGSNAEFEEELRQRSSEIASLNREIGELKSRRAADAQALPDGEQAGTPWYAQTWVLLLWGSMLGAVIAALATTALSRRKETDADEAGGGSAERETGDDRPEDDTSGTTF